jgi:hypothetical protein
MWRINSDFVLDTPYNNFILPLFLYQFFHTRENWWMIRDNHIGVPLDGFVKNRWGKIIGKENGANFVRG